jgi:hypothetical protein
VGWDSSSELALVDSVWYGDNDMEPLCVEPLAVEIPVGGEEFKEVIEVAPELSPSKWVLLMRVMKRWLSIY